MHFLLVPEEVVTFLAIAREGSLRNAARAVHASQSTVSYRLQTLEQRLGRPLVERGRGVRQVALTPAGARFLAVAEQWEHLVREMERIHGRGDVALAVGTAHALSLHLLAPLYRWLGSVEPRPVLRIETSGGHTLCDRVALRRLDAAFVFFDRAHAELSVQPFASSPMVVIRSSTPAPVPDTGPVAVGELPAGGEIHMSWGPDFDMWRERTLQDEPPVTLETAHSLVPFLTLPGSWSVVPEFVADELTRLGLCTSHRLAEPPPDRVIYLVTNKRAAPSSPALALLSTALRATTPELAVAPAEPPAVLPVGLRR